MSNLSILVVSKTAQLLSELLRSIPNALQGFSGDVEVLCSWNGSAEEEQSVAIPAGIEFYFSQRTPYHFASNCNQLAQQACGDLLLFINDDLTLDPGSIHAAIETLELSNQCGIVGAKLINKAGKVGHAGILFDHTHKPFHRYLDSPVDHPLTERTERVPAATGAFLLTRARDYARCPMNETYINNGEDVELCLAYKTMLGLHTYVCHRTTGKHPERSTRGKQNTDTGFGNDNSADLARMRKFRQQFLANLSREDIAQELDLANRESSWRDQKIATLAADLQREQIRNDEALSKDVLAHANSEQLISLQRTHSEQALDKARRDAELEISQSEQIAERARQRALAWKQTFRSNRNI